MTDPPRYFETNEGTGTGAEADRESGSGTPRWVKVFGIVALLVALLVAILLLTVGPGGHGPGRHTAPLSVTDHTTQQL